MGSFQTPLSGDGSNARRAFDAVAETQQARSFAELNETTQKRFQHLGFSVAIGVYARPHEHGAEVDLLFGHIDHPWLLHYEERGWNRRCPISAAIGPQPLTWNDIRERSLNTAQQELFFAEMGTFSLTQGHLVAVDCGSRGMACVSLAGADFDPRDPEARAVTHLLSIYYGMAGFRLLGEESFATPRPSLTARQIECLRWVRNGKSSWEIGSIIGVSDRTVEEHLAKACRSLGVRGRVQAVLAACRLGFLEL